MSLSCSHENCPLFQNMSQKKKKKEDKKNVSSLSWSYFPQTFFSVKEREKRKLISYLDITQKTSVIAAWVFLFPPPPFLAASWRVPFFPFFSWPWYLALSAYLPCNTRSKLTEYIKKTNLKPSSKRNAGTIWRERRRRRRKTPLLPMQQVGLGRSFKNNNNNHIPMTHNYHAPFLLAVRSLNTEKTR